MPLYRISIRLCAKSGQGIPQGNITYNVTKANLTAAIKNAKDTISEQDACPLKSTFDVDEMNASE